MTLRPVARFYVLTGVIQGQELDDLTREFERLLDNAPFGGGQIEQAYL
jgi:hypothetical protein